MEVFLSHSPEDTEAFAAKLADKLRKGDVLALYGEMGAGKTALVRGLVGALCPECLPLVHSPTFAIVNEYAGSSVTLYHFDFYRIKDEDDLYSTGFFECIDGDGIVVTEWSEKVESAIPGRAKKLTIEKGEGTERRLLLC